MLLRKRRRNYEESMQREMVCSTAYREQSRAAVQRQHRAANKDKIANIVQLVGTVAVGQGQATARGQAGCEKKTNSELLGHQELQIELAHVKQTAVETTQVRGHQAIPPRVDPGLKRSVPRLVATAMEEKKAAKAGAPRGGRRHGQEKRCRRYQQNIQRGKAVCDGFNRKAMF